MNIVLESGYLADFAAAAAWLESQQTGLAFELGAEIQRKLPSIAQFPESYACIRTGAKGRQFRQASLHRFKYSLIFEVTGSTVRVLALAHYRRRGIYWRNR